MEEDAEVQVIEKPKRETFESFDKKVFPSAPFCPGCGSLIGLKIALQAIKNPILIANGHIASLCGSVPMLVFPDAAAAAQAAAKTADATKNTIVCFSGSSETFSSLNSLIKAASAGSKIIYICCNENALGAKISKIMSMHAEYAASAAISHYEDYAKKLKKASERSGFSFIDLLAPCPQQGMFDTSNTVLVSSMAVETCAWPLYEVENKKLSLSAIPSAPEPAERYLEMISAGGADRQKAQEKINEEWKLLREGRLLRH